MKEMLRYGFILGLICLVASGLLAGMNSLTKDRIIAQEKSGEEAALLEVMPSAQDFEPVKSDGDILYYKAKDKNGQPVGFIFKASAKGYSNTIETLVGMKKDGSISAIKVLSQNETPGLGSRVVEPSFTGQFANKDTQNLDQVAAITGATISSTAVIESVKKKAEEIKGLINEK
jgi:electron transport complex protein RnfG